MMATEKPQTTYTLLVEGEVAPPELLTTIQLLEVEDHAKMADMLHLRILIGVNDIKSGWTIIDDGRFDRLSRIQVKVTVGSGPAVLLIDSYVIESRVQFSNQPGKSVLDVYAMDPTVLMNLDEKVRAWPNMKHSEIAQQIFDEYSFAAVIDDTPVSYDEQNTQLTQRGTDIQFLQKLAQRNGFECFIEANAQGKIEGHFHKPKVEDSPQAVLSVNSGEATNVNLFNTRFDMIKPAQAVAATLDIESQSDQKGDVSEQSLHALGSRSAVGGDRPRRILIAQTGLTSTSELQAYAQGMVDESSFAITAEGELNTVAFGSILAAKKTVNVRGAGRQYSGVYYVEKVLHTFTGDGYRQKFRLRRNAIGLQGQENFAEDTALKN
jgi:phage protein D